MKARLRSREQGFTLIELLVVLPFWVCWRR